MPLPKLLFSFSGRINRAKVWLGFLMMGLVLAVQLAILLGVANAIGEFDRDTGVKPVSATALIVTLLLFVWMTFAIYAKRAHDRGWSGWFSLVLLVPLIGMWPFIELIFLPGDAAANRFGEPPVGRQ